MNFFTSDLHFLDTSTMRHDNRPFKTPTAYARTVIKNFNRRMKKGDTLYVIGDWTSCKGEGDERFKASLPLVKKVHADVVLILGNNEERVIKNFFGGDFETFSAYCKALGFKDVFKTLDVKVAGQLFHLTHKPKNHAENCLSLFGHSHRALGVYTPFGFNVYCDLNHFFPYSETDIAHLLELKSRFWDKDENLHLTK